MAETKKPGLFKRMFSFGLSGKDEDKTADKGVNESIDESKVKKAKPKQGEAKKHSAKKTADKKTTKPKPDKNLAKDQAKDSTKAGAKNSQETKAKTKTKKAAAPKSEAFEDPTLENPNLEQASIIAPTPKSAPQNEQKDDDSDSRLALSEHKKADQQKPPKQSSQQQAEKVGWLKRLTKGLSRSSEQLSQNITKVFTDKKLDDDTLQELEDVLIQADLGVETAMKITDNLASKSFGKSVTDKEIRQVMAEEVEKILDPVAQDLELDLDHQPHVILVVGVNGSGKTTTIGKLASKLYDAGFSTSLVAGDTFRAAAIEQLKIWGERTLSPVLFRELGSDAAGLAFDAWQMAKDDGRDVLLIDTAGRLQNKKELMDELEKIIRVLKKKDPSAPHTILLTLDATTGQNAMNQVEIFKDVAGVNGLVMTKLDGTARGGILVAISAKHKLPVYFVGVGETVADLEPFEAADFARSIAGLNDEV